MSGNLNPGHGLHRYGWRKDPPHAPDARGPFEGARCVAHPMSRAEFLAAIERWNANPHGWHYWPLDVDATKPAPSYFDHFPPASPFPDYNPARDGWTVKALAEYLTSYARKNPDAIVRFTSCGMGGRWPEGKGAMGFFTDHQAAVVDGSRVGEGVTMSISLMPFDRNPPAPLKWPGQQGTL